METHATLSLPPPSVPKLCLDGFLLHELGPGVTLIELVKLEVSFLVSSFRK